jgi:hypothetical protein
MKNYNLFWERLANSGIIHMKANTAKEAIEKIGYRLDTVKLTAIELKDNAESLTLGKIG